MNIQSSKTPHLLLRFTASIRRILPRFAETVIFLTIFPQKPDRANRRKTRQITAIKEEKPQ